MFFCKSQRISIYYQPMPRKSFFEIVSENPPGFVFWFLLIFLVLFSVFYVAGFIPDEIAGNVPIVEPEVKGEVPIHITIPAIKVDAVVEHPETSDIDTLDAALKHSVVYYPGSGLLGKGNTFLFGHSTSYKIVNNQAYKVFNDLKKLKTGDDIIVVSNTKKYIYRVSKVSLVSADKALVEFDTKRVMLTLSSCNTFGAKEERYVVEADFVEIQ